MGQDLTQSHFKVTDFKHYHQCLQQELNLLKRWQANEARISTSDSPQMKAGVELEACLVTAQGQPAFNAPELIRQIKHPQICPELANFNLEFNSSVFPLKRSVLSDLHHELTHLLEICSRQSHDTPICLAGILPSLRQSDLGMNHMAPLKRYLALNEQILKARRGKTLKMDITGKDSLHLQQSNVMMESLTTSFQLHLQLPFDCAHRYYNSAIIASAPVVALAANSPYVFGKQLWHESRIPIFEQAIAAGGFDGAAFGPIKRAGFGEGYVKQSLIECFQENIDHYPVLLPDIQPTRPDKLAHLLLHNGTIWRWNRPLVGIAANQYHWRLEHRALPAGPSLVDNMANAAFFYGLVNTLANQYLIAEQHLDFNRAKDNFYRLAKSGLESKIYWFDNHQYATRNLLLEQLIPMARDGLSCLQIDRCDIDKYLGIIEQRVDSGRTGAVWQMQWLEKNCRGRQGELSQADLQRLTQTYLGHQQKDRPVHEWPLES